MLSMLVPCRHVDRKPRISPPWLRRFETAIDVISLLSFLPALYLFITGLVQGNPVRDVLSRIGATPLLPVVSFVQETMTPMKVVGFLISAQYPQFYSWLTAIPTSTIDHIFLTAVGLCVGSLGLTCLIALVLPYGNNRLDWRDVASW